MEIHALKVQVTEADLNRLIALAAPPELPVEKLKVQLAPEGMTISGVYPLFVNVHFESLWELSVVEAKVHAKLAKVKVMGMPGAIFKSAVLKMLEEQVRRDDALQLANETLIIDADRVLGKLGFPSRTNLQSLSCASGQLTLEAGV